MDNDNAPGLPPEVLERLRAKAVQPQEQAPAALWFHEVRWYENDKRMRIKQRCNPVLLVEGAQRVVPEFSIVIVIPVPQVDPNPPFDIVENLSEIEIPIEATTIADAFNMATQDMLQKAANHFHRARAQAALMQQADLRKNKPLIATARAMPPGARG